MLNRDDVVRMTQKMRAIYGRKFDQQWEKISPSELVDVFQQATADLTAEELRRGFAALMSREWPPTVPEFVKLCRPISLIDQAWKSPDEAWAIAQGNLSELTTFATCDEIQQAWEVAKAVGNDRYAARRAFIDRYAALVDVSKGLGKKPVWRVSMGQEPAEQRAQAIEHLIEVGTLSADFREQADQLHLQARPVDVAGLIAQAPDEATNPETGKKDRIRSHLSALKNVLKMDDAMDRRRQQAEAEQQALEAERRRQIEALGHAAPRELDPFSQEDWPDYCRGLAATGRKPAQTLIDHHQQLRAAQPMAEDL